MTATRPFTLATRELRLLARLTPWDTECFGFAVGQVDSLECLSPSVDSHTLGPLFRWLDENAVRFISCRLPHERLRESMLLESCQFRFIETVLHPCLDLPDTRYTDNHGLVIAHAVPSDIPVLEGIASSAFIHGRIQADPRLGSDLSLRRYGRWVRNVIDHPRQRLLKITNYEGMIVGLFVIEPSADQSVYWHLTAISPSCQGKGYGWRAWRAMLAHHAQEGFRSVQTTITATNVAVLNLYAKLGFRFLPPEMTFHWVRSDS